jgi:hypothetical protein
MACGIESGRMPQKEAGMFKKNANGRRIAATLLAIALSACGSFQGASPARAGLSAAGPAGNVHLTEFDPNDTVKRAPTYLPAWDQNFGAGGQIDSPNATGFGSIGSEGAGGPYLTH